MRGANGAEVLPVLLDEAGEQLQRVGPRHTVGIKYPKPVVTARKRVFEPGFHRAARAQIRRMSDYRDAGRIGQLRGPIGRSVVDEKNVLDGPGLPRNRVQHGRDNFGVIPGVDVDENSHIVRSSAASQCVRNQARS
jgi:hypothetical protein